MNDFDFDDVPRSRRRAGFGTWFGNAFSTTFGVGCGLWGLAGCGCLMSTVVVVGLILAVLGIGAATK